MIEYAYWGIISYEEAWKKQEELFNDILTAKKEGKPYVNRIIFCEHPHVYTLGRNGKENNLLVNLEQLDKIEATYFHTDRGGDITYHGPGQLVCYPIINLEDFEIGLKDYVWLLEEAVIKVCLSYGIKAERLINATGVWIDSDKTSARKICAIGVKSSKFVTMHGLAFNINTNLNYFNYINPCGFINKGVTSLEKEIGRKIDMKKVICSLKASLVFKK